MKKTILFTLMLGASSAFAADLPNYDQDKFCKIMARNRSSVEEACQEMEKTAKGNLEKLTIEDRTIERCNKVSVSNGGGGSFSLFEACVLRAQQRRK